MSTAAETKQRADFEALLVAMSSKAGFYTTASTTVPREPDGSYEIPMVNIAWLMYQKLAPLETDPQAAFKIEMAEHRGYSDDEYRYALQWFRLGWNRRGPSTTAASPAPGDWLFKVARLLSDRSATACGVNKDDNWKVYSEQFYEEARAIETLGQPSTTAAAPDDEFAKAIGYPEQWDTAAYPTMESAMIEVLTWAAAKDGAPSDGTINDITLRRLGKWPSFEAQSWACKVVHAVMDAELVAIPSTTAAAPGIGEWRYAQLISEVPTVEEALKNFSHDSTEDNGICLVREVLRQNANVREDGEPSTTAAAPEIEPAQLPAGYQLRPYDELPYHQYIAAGWTMQNLIDGGLLLAVDTSAPATLTMPAAAPGVGYTVWTDPNLAFKASMRGYQYGKEETEDARVWFMKGWAAKTPSPLCPPPPTVEQLAEQLIRECYRVGKVVTITAHPLTPLAMGNHHMVADFREVCK